ncbi:MAG: AraC family transcriptional regulator [Candidatus Pseudobacter hemicellulosilyticus]|uniref:AraC family transcriptional regulator n=1 Tax=Candidatus Pseudobacter hemicellulosilyticus TaxID=3121375 RepID=A0AAJ5WXI7_9BACT|nr:MAG: AraC family transcriptional regulator [Pseudobacter sp.]
MTLKPFSLYRDQNVQILHARFKATQASSWEMTAEYPVSLVFCLKGPVTSATIKGKYHADAFLALFSGNFICHPGSIVQLKWQKSATVELLVIGLRKEFLTSLAGSDVFKKPASFHLLATGKEGLAGQAPWGLPLQVVNGLNDLLQGSQRPIAFQDLFIKAKLMEIVALFLSRMQELSAPAMPRHSHHQLAVLAKKHIDAVKGKKRFTIIGLAKDLGTNETTLKQAFRTAYGKPLFRYFQERNMQAAKKALQAGQSITTVAAGCGYTYIAHFSHAFKKEFGISPSQCQLT